MKRSAKQLINLILHGIACSFTGAGTSARFWAEAEARSWIGTKIAVKGGAALIRYFVLVAIFAAAAKLIFDAVKAL